MRIARVLHFMSAGQSDMMRFDCGGTFIVAVSSLAFKPTDS